MVPPTLTSLAQWAGITMPTLYAGTSLIPSSSPLPSSPPTLSPTFSHAFAPLLPHTDLTPRFLGITFQYSLTMHLLAQTTTTTTPPKLLARQWLALYQQGPVWVPPLIHTGFLANLYLAFTQPPSSPSRVYYLTAAILTLSILPLTFLYFEPGINGACKWKSDILLREEKGYRMMPERRKGQLVAASVVRHSASEKAKRWAEGAEMGFLVEAWARVNHVRWVVGVVAGVVSFVGLREGCHGWNFG